MAMMSVSISDRMLPRLDEARRRRGFRSRAAFIRSLINEEVHKEPQKAEFEIRVFRKKPLAEVRRAFEITGKYSKKFIDDVIDGLAHSSIYAGKRQTT